MPIGVNGALECVRTQYLIKFLVESALFSSTLLHAFTNSAIEEAQVVYHKCDKRGTL
jgi:hypothetical protein